MPRLIDQIRDRGFRTPVKSAFLFPPSEMAQILARVKRVVTVDLVNAMMWQCAERHEEHIPGMPDDMIEEHGLPCVQAPAMECWFEYHHTIAAKAAFIKMNPDITWETLGDEGELILRRPLPAAYPTRVAYDQLAQAVRDWNPQFDAATMQEHLSFWETEAGPTFVGADVLWLDRLGRPAVPHLAYSHTPKASHPYDGGWRVIDWFTDSPILTGIFLLHGKHSELIRRVPPSRQRSDPEGTKSHTVYHVLDIRPLLTIVEGRRFSEDARDPGSTGKRRLHSVIGHWRGRRVGDVNDERWREIVWQWVESYWRGDIANGIVVKDYRVACPAMSA